MYQSDSNILAGLGMRRSLMEMGDTLKTQLSKKGNKCKNIQSAQSKKRFFLFSPRTYGVFSR